jgi:DNA segregation ATPase FtsK/SpoIIIE, S-DNA-T family
MTRLAFHRPARFRPPDIPEEKLVLPNPPEASEGAGGGTILTIILGLLSSVGMAAYMVTFGRPVMILIGVTFALVAVGTTVAMVMQTRGAHRRAGRKQRRRYRALLAQVRQQARAVAAQQRRLSAVQHPEPARLWAIVRSYRRVWERRAADDDFLHVRVGTGRTALATPIQVGSRMDPMVEYDWYAMRAARRIATGMGRVADQPAVIDLGKAGVVSILAAPVQAAELVRSLLGQVAVLHAPDDVGIAVDSSDGQPWEWAKWLPHTFEPDVPGAAGAVPLVGDTPDALADYLERDLQERQERAAVRRGALGLDRETPQQRRLVVVFTGFRPMTHWGRSPLLRQLLAAAGPQLGITLLFLVEAEADEPSRVDLRLRVTEDGGLSTEGDRTLVVADTQDVVPDRMSAELAELIARGLCPLRVTDDEEQVLARDVSLTEMLLGGDPAEVDFAARWLTAADPRVLEVPIGTDGDGNQVRLDIKESARGGSGPHGLIVGATGSGKSELLRTLVTGMSMIHPPEVLNFVLIDFKGGAAFAPLAGLPHVAGLITNLVDDAGMVDRVHAALQGEQQRRQQMLRAAGNVDSLHHYQLKQAAGGTDSAGRPLEPLPYLLIIVDEFSELLSDRPDLADLFVQIGRVGRSLGMHLLMATQRLEEGKLRGLDSHLSYRICLRTFSAGESRQVIGTTDAYRLPPIPGSAYLKVDESIYQRLRVAHVSAPYRSAAERAAEPGLDGEPIAPYELRNAPAEEPTASAEEQAEAAMPSGPTELSVLVDRIGMAGRPAHQVWLPPLPPAIPLDALVGPPATRSGRGLVGSGWPLVAGLKVPVGVIDLPLQQDQQPLMMDFSGAHGHLAAVGAPRMGRSTLLRTVMLAGMLTHTPEEMQFYCIDFGGGSLHAFSAAPHVGAVAGRNDGALLNRILAEVGTLIVAREHLFRELGIDSIVEFRERRDAGLLPPGTRAADVFLVIDNWGAVRSDLEEADGIVADIAARGLGVGVHLVLTAGRWMDIRTKLRDSIGTRLELRLNDPADSEVGRRIAAMLPSVPGRGLAPPGVFTQMLLPRLDGEETAEGLREAQEDALRKISAAWTGTPAPPVRLLPDRVEARELPVDDGPGVPIGLAEADLRPIRLDLLGGDPHLMVFGDAGSGKTEFLRTWARGLARTTSAWDVRVIVVDYRRTLLGAVPEEHLGGYAADADSARTYAEQVAEKLRERMPPPGISVQELRDRSWWTGPEVYVVVDDYDLVGGQAGALAALAEFLPHARDVGLHLLIARRVTNSTRLTFGDPVIGRMKELGCAGLVLDGDPREGAIFGDERAQHRQPGRGVLLVRGRPGQLVQLALDPDEEPAPAYA